MVFEQANPSAEEWNDVVIDVRKREHARVLQEEGTFFGKEQGEARQIDLSAIDLCFGEIRVDGRADFQIWRELKERIQAPFAAQRVSCRPRIVRRVAGTEGSQ